jgi:hypothetical protein
LMIVWSSARDRRDPKGRGRGTKGRPAAGGASAREDSEAPCCAAASEPGGAATYG